MNIENILLSYEKMGVHSLPEGEALIKRITRQ